MKRDGLWRCVWFSSLLVCLAIQTFLSLSSASGAVTSPWPMIRHDPQGTAMSPYTGPTEAGVLWKATVASGNSQPAIASDGTVYVSGSDGLVYALNPNGSVKWSVDVDVSYHGRSHTPAIGLDGTVYVRGNWLSRLYALHPSDGHELWHVDIEEGYGAPVVGSDGTIYIGNGYKTHAIRPDGTVKWNSTAVTDYYLALSPDESALYTRGWNGLCALNTVDGSVKWEALINGKVAKRPAAGPDGTIYVTLEGYPGVLAAVHPSDGHLLWSLEMGGSSAGPPAIDAARNTVYAASLDNHLYAVSFSGGLKWKFPVGCLWGESAPVIGGDGIVYLGDVCKETLFAVDPTTGREKWGIHPGPIGDTAPAIGPDGTLYIGAAWEGLLVAIGEQKRTLYGGNEYLFVHRHMTWHDAKAYAESLGGHLAVIRDFDQNDFLDRLATQHGRTGEFWIGLTDEASEGNFVWVTGEPLEFTAWYGGQPGPEDYVIVSPNCCYGPWFTRDGAEPRQFMVEFEQMTLVAYPEGPDRVNPGQEATFLVKYRNRLNETAKDVVVTLGVPRNFSYVSSTHNGIYRYDPDYEVVFWKLGDLVPGGYGEVAVTLSIPWGLPDYTGSLQANIGARNAQSSIPMDIDDYLNYVPRKIVFEKRLTVPELNAVLSTDETFKDLFEYALSLGYEFKDVAFQRITNDGVISFTLILLDRSEHGFAMVYDIGDATYIEKYTAEQYAILDKTGGYSQSLKDGSFNMWGEWAETHSLAFGQCFRNCVYDKTNMFLIGKVFNSIGAIVNASNCYKCFLYDDENSCAGCMSAIMGKDSIGIVSDVKKCWHDCSDPKEVNNYACTPGHIKYTCDPEPGLFYGGMSSILGRDYRLRFECNSMGYYGEGKPVWCASGDKCLDGACVECASASSSARASCESKQYQVTPAHDPNAKLVDVPGSVVPGQRLTYTVEYENEGGGTAYDVFILDELDPSLDESTLVINNGGVYSPHARLLSWDIGELAPGQQGQVTFSVNVRGSLPAGTEIINVAEVHFPSASEITPTNPVVSRVSRVTANPQNLEIVSGDPLAITLTGQDAGAGPLTFRLMGGPLNGQLTGTPPSITYVSDPNFNGMDSFSFVAHNGVTQSDPAVVRILVKPSPYDVTRPSVVGTYPKPNETGIRVSDTEIGPDIFPPTLTATFSEPVNPATVNTATFQVNGLIGSVSYDVLTRTAYFHPSLPLQPSTVYTATVTTGVKDNSGNSMAANYAWHFMTVGSVALKVTLPPPNDFLSFGTVSPNTTTGYQVVTVSNVGLSDLAIGGIGLSGLNPSDFLKGEDTCSGRTLGAGELCTVQAAFSPDTEGDKGAILTIPSNDPDTPHEVPLIGKAKRGLKTKPVIQVNDAGGTVYVDPAGLAEISVALSPDDMAGVRVDWWIGVFTPFGTYWLDPSINWRPSGSPVSVGQYGLFDLGKTPILNVQLPLGLYTFFYVLDNIPNGVLDDLSWYDYVNVICQPKRAETEAQSADLEALFLEKMKRLMTP